MFDETQGALALAAVAGFTNGEPEGFVLGRADTVTELIYVTEADGDEFLTNRAFVYSVKSNKVYPVGGDIEPLRAMEIVAERDA